MRRALAALLLLAACAQDADDAGEEFVPADASEVAKKPPKDPCEGCQGEECNLCGRGGLTGVKFSLGGGKPSEDGTTQQVRICYPWSPPQCWLPVPPKTCPCQPIPACCAPPVSGGSTRIPR